jgi:hypothetical protein
MRRVLLGITAALALTLTGAPAVSAATPTGATSGGNVQITGDLSTPATLTAAQIAAFPTTTLPLATPGGGTRDSVTGALLTDVLASAGPVFGAGKNPQLHAAIAVTGQSGWRINLAYGELDPGFGNHPALLTVTGTAVSLVVPGDTTRLRSVPRVAGITLTSLPTPVTTPPARAVTVIRGHRTHTLPATILARLPQQQRTVTFLSGTTPQTHTENGPALTAVLLAAGITPLPNTTVTAVGSDGYGATVTNGEALLGGRPLLLSLTEDGTPLTQPRLVTDGDVKGGRYVSEVVTLNVT